MRNSIEIMIEEHTYIKRLLKVIRKASLDIFNGGKVDADDFEDMIDFVRNYADKHHHGKEEKFLFVEMIDHLGPLANKLITHGMLVEHDLGRLYMSDAHDALDKVREGNEESKLDLVANVMGYAYLLNRHIDKENTVVFTFAEKQLPKVILEKVDASSHRFEEEAMEKGTQKYYIDMLERLEAKYL
ncbi:MAG: hemerythrin domain-containing protein [Clostridiales bacterium]|nr:hemerythrin domain-containing protein [Clostridiales bacterium]